MNKLTSRKFWICVAAFLASLSTSITALHTDNEILAMVGIVCTIASAAVYATAEACVDASRCEAELKRNDENRREEVEFDEDSEA